MKGNYSISCSDGSIRNGHDPQNTTRSYERIRAHDLREKTPANADERLSYRNVVILKTDSTYKEAFNEIFRPAREAYNEKQTRKSRKKSPDYWDEIISGRECKGRLITERDSEGNVILDKEGNPRMKDRREKVAYEIVVQCGDHVSNGLTRPDFPIKTWKKYKREGRQKEADKLVDQYLNHSPEREELKQILIDEAEKLPEKYPNLKFLSIVGHDDEVAGTFHVHACYVPVAHYSKGVALRDSHSRALAEMGFKSNEKDKEYGVTAFQSKIKDDLEAAMNAHGFTRDDKDCHRERKDVHAYTARKELEEEIVELTAERDDLSTKVSELSGKADELNEEVIKLEDRKTELLSSSGLSVADLDMRENELNQQMLAQEEVRDALDAQDKGYQQSLAAHESKCAAYQKRYSKLFSGVMGLIKTGPEPVRPLLTNLVRGLDAMDALDRYGISKVEKQIEKSDTAYADTKRQLDRALASARAKTRRTRGRQAENLNRDIEHDRDTVDREMEF